MANIYGRQVVLPLTNKSGGGLVAGDVVIVDTSNDGSVTTTTSGQSQSSVGIAQETIANNATGRILVAGYAAVVNVPSSMTRGRFLETHTVAKQATGNATRRAGSFGQFLTGGTTPTAWLWGFPDNAGASGETVATSTIWDTAGDLVQATGADAASKLSIGTAGQHLTVNSGATAAAWTSLRSTLGTTSAGASFATARGTYIKKVTLPADSFVMSIHAFVKGNAANAVGLSAGILSDSGGAPVSVIAVGGPVYKESDSSPNTNLGLSTTVRDISIAIGRWLTAGDYWIGVTMHAAADSRIQLAYNAGTGADRKNAFSIMSDQSYNTYGSSDTNDYCIYADLLS